MSGVTCNTVSQHAIPGSPRRWSLPRLLEMDGTAHQLNTSLLHALSIKMVSSCVLCVECAQNSNCWQTHLVIAAREYATGGISQEVKTCVCMGKRQAEGCGGPVQKQHPHPCLRFPGNSGDPLQDRWMNARWLYRTMACRRCSEARPRSCSSTSGCTATRPAATAMWRARPCAKR